MNKRLAVAIVSIAILAGCAAEAKFRSVGQHDPTVQIAEEREKTLRALAEALKAQAEALERVREATPDAPTNDPTPTPTPTPEAR